MSLWLVESVVRLSKGVGLFNLRAAHSTFDDFVEKPQEVGKIDPETAIETASV
jgi:hypothetical protein